MKNKLWFKSILVLITLAVSIGCGIFTYIEYKGGKVLFTDEQGFYFRVGIAALLFLINLLISLIYKRDIWKLAGIITAAFPIMGKMIAESKLPHIFPINIKTLNLLEVLLPLGIVCLLSLISIFKEIDFEDHSSTTTISNYTSNYSGTGAFGFPEEMGPNYHPDKLPPEIEYKDY